MVASGARTPQTLGILEVTKSYETCVRVEYPSFGIGPLMDAIYGTVCMVATMQGLDVDEPWTRQLDR